MLAVGLFELFAACLRLGGQRRRRAREQPGNTDRLTGVLAIAVLAFVDPLQGFVDLLQQLALALADARARSMSASISSRWA